MSDQAKNVKKAFSKTFESVNVVEITQALLNRQRKVDLIKERKEWKDTQDQEREMAAVAELYREIDLCNTVSPTVDRMKSLGRDDVLLFLDDDPLTDTLTQSITDQCDSSSKQDKVSDNIMNDAEDKDGSFGGEEMDMEEFVDESGECPYEAELRMLDEEHDEFTPSKYIYYCLTKIVNQSFLKSENLNYL